MRDNNFPENDLSVAHYHPVWLPATMTWLDQLVADLGKHCHNLILCEQIANIEQFRIDNAFVFSKLPRLNRTFQRFLRKSGLRKAFPFYVHALKKERAQLLHSHFGHIAVQGSKIALQADIPHAASFYGLDIHQIPAADPGWKRHYLDMFAHTRRIFCEGKYMAQCIEELGCPVEKLTVHPLGVDLDKVKFKPATWDGNEPLRILIAASFREKKGIPLALKASAALRESIPLHITIIGDATPDSASKLEKKKILDTIQQYKLVEVTDLRGFLTHNEMLAEAENHHIFLSPSIHAEDGDCEGGAPVGIIEMSASGIMVVSSTHCDIPGVVLDGKTGWLAEEGNVDHLIETLNRTVNQHNRWHQIAAEAKKHIEAHFDARKQARILHGHYQEIIRE